LLDEKGDPGDFSRTNAIQHTLHEVKGSSSIRPNVDLVFGSITELLSNQPFQLLARD
jgi:hypothetical protein